MKFKYGKYIPSLADEVDMEELVSALSEMLLSSGFQTPYGDGSVDGDRTMQALHDAILDALLNGGLLPDDVLEQLFGEQARDGEAAARRAGAAAHGPACRRRATSRRRRSSTPNASGGPRRAAARARASPGRTEFEVTDKALDFLGYRALRDLLGSIGHASAGRHDTRDMATGIDASGAPKPYEFGDTLQPRRQQHGAERRDACAPRAADGGSWPRSRSATRT